MELPEAATQTYKKGALVTFVAGYITECGADPALIAGIAERDGQNIATSGLKRVSVTLAHPATLFLGYLDTSAAEGAGVSAATDRGLSYGVAKNAATGKWYIDKTDVTAKRVTIWELWDQVSDAGLPAWGDIMTPVLFTFAAPFCNITAVT